MKIKGEIIKGIGLAKLLGFPTINLVYLGEERGVFAARVAVHGDSYLAAVNLGPKPTFGIDEVFLEAHLIDLDKIDVKEGQVVEVELLEKIRDVNKFESAGDLSRQIARDIEFVRNLR